MESFFSSLYEKLISIDAAYLVVTGIVAIALWVMFVHGFKWVGKGFISANVSVMKREKKDGFVAIWKSYKSDAFFDYAKFIHQRYTAHTGFWMLILLGLFIHLPVEKGHDFSWKTLIPLIPMLFFQRNLYLYGMGLDILRYTHQLRTNPKFLKGRARRRRRLPPITNPPPSPSALQA